MQRGERHRAHDSERISLRASTTDTKQPVHKSVDVTF